jgi:GTP cyclohydrolase I
MPEYVTISRTDFEERCGLLAERIKQSGKEYKYLFGVPRGGTQVALVLHRILGIPIVDRVRWNALVVDDVVDSGRTREKYEKYDFACLHVTERQAKTVQFWAEEKKEWIRYWYEPARDIEDTIVRQLEYIGEDAAREGLKETPARVVRAWGELYGGYKMDPASILKVFEEDNSDEMVLLCNIEFVSMCEHHMLPFIGHAHVAYLPGGKLIGASKLARLVEIYARRLQIQERLCKQVTGWLTTNLEAQGAACLIEAQHLCMTARGIKKQEVQMVTSSLEGVFKTDPATRAEFLTMVNHNRR